MKVWQIDYKGHRIRVENRFNRERLFVDDGLQDEQTGLFESRSRLYGKIKHGDGEGESIKVSIGGFFSVGCRIFVNDTLVYSGK